MSHNSTSAGDGLSFSVGRNARPSNGFGVSGFFDVKHQSAETGEVSDHSFKNCILLAGVESMLKGLTSNATANGSGVASTKTGIWLSGVNTAIARGTNATTATYTSLLCAASDTTDRLYPNDSNTTVDLSSAIQSGAGGVWFQTSKEDIFAQPPSFSDPNTDIVSDSIVIKANVSGTSQVVDGIFVCNQTVNSDSNAAYNANTVLLMAGRTTQTSGNASEKFTPAITMNHNDTLTITYTLRITVD